MSHLTLHTPPPIVCVPPPPPPTLPCSLRRLPHATSSVHLEVSRGDRHGCVCLCHGIIEGMKGLTGSRTFSVDSFSLYRMPKLLISTASLVKFQPFAFIAPPDDQTNELGPLFPSDGAKKCEKAAAVFGFYLLSVSLCSLLLIVFIAIVRRLPISVAINSKATLVFTSGYIDVTHPQQTVKQARN